MAKLNINEAQEMASRGDFSFKFFNLRDRETMKVRFLYSDINEVESYSVHSITLPDGKKKNVNCLRLTNEPVQNCPLCAIGNKPRARIYLNLVNEKTHELLVWERSAQFLDTLEGYIKRYGDLRDYVFEIERKGSGLDTNYEIYPMGSNPIEDKSVLPKPADILGTVFLNKTYDDLSTFVNEGKFPEETKPVVDVERRNQNDTPQANQNNQQQDSNPWNNSDRQKRSGWN